MDRGGTGLRRGVVVAVMFATLGTLVVHGGATATAEGGFRGPGAQARLGEPGSGPSPLPVQLPLGRSPRAASFAWSDLDGSDAWARTAIDFVGKQHDWMRDFAAKLVKSLRATAWALS